MTYEELYTEDAVFELQDAGIQVPEKEDMTCNNCPERDTCDLAWDLYNINGDCLALK
jgi:hypothetical protein